MNRGQRTKWCFVYLLIMAAWPASAWAEASLNVTVRPRSVDLNDVVRVTVQAITEQEGSLEAPEFQDWEVVSRSQRTSISYGNRGQRKVTVIELGLQPTKIGTLSINPFVLKSEGKSYKSHATRVAVTGNAVPPPASRQTNAKRAPAEATTSDNRPTQAPDEVAFLRWEVNRDSVWLGEPIDARLCIYYRDGLRVSQFKNGKIDLSGFWNEKFDQKSDRAERVRVGDLVFIRDEIAHYTLFPTRSGQRQLPAIKTSMTVQRNSFFRRGRKSKLERTVPALPMTVKALPTKDRPASYRGIVVGQTRLVAKVDRRTVSADKGVELKVTTTIDGLIQNVPAVRLPESKDWKVYPTPPKTSVRNLDGGRIRSARNQSWLLRPTRKGNLTIPAFKITYFDPGTGRYRVARTRRIMIQAKGAFNDSAGPSSNDRGSTTSDLALQSVRTDIDITKAPIAAGRTLWFYTSLYGSPLAFICFLGLGHYRRRRADSAGTRARRGAGKTAERALEAIRYAPDTLNQGYASLTAIFTEYLSLRLDQPAQGLTHDQIKTRLRDHQVPDPLIRRVIETLEAADFARFARAGTETDLRDSVRHAHTLIADLEKAWT
ncbi:MAG: BatD family protein [Myxococcota bacterium]|nr:BatD family protein [Myxococcota bacterium]